MVAKYWNKKGGMELLTGLEGLDFMERANEAHFKNREAEEAWARKQIWGSDESGGGSSSNSSSADQQGSNEMRQTILGDYHPPSVVYPPMPPQPAPQQPQSSGAGKAAAAAALTAASLLGGGAAGYLLSNAGKSDQAVQQPSDTDFQMGLGKMEDYFPSPQQGQPQQSQPPQIQAQRPSQYFVPAPRLGE